MHYIKHIGMHMNVVGMATSRGVCSHTSRLQLKIETKLLLWDAGPSHAYMFLKLNF